MNSTGWLHAVTQSINKNAPVILTVFGAAGAVSAAVLAVRYTPQATRHITQAAIDKADAEGEDAELTKTDILKAAWKDYVPAALTGTAALACIVGANQIGMRRNAALLGAYSLADTALREYKDEVFQQIGKVKERKIHDEVQKKKIDDNPVKDSQVIITGGGDQLCYESLTGRYFRSDIEQVRRAENELNRRILTDMCATLNEFFELLGLESTALGEELGWNIENTVEVVYTSHLASDGHPCLALGYVRLPRIGYSKF